MNKKQELQRRQEDISLVRALYWLGGSAILEFFMILVNRYYINFTTSAESVKMAKTMYSILSVGRIVTIAGAVAIICYLLFRFKSGQTPLHFHVCILGAFSVATICAHFTLIFGAVGVQMLLILIPALGGLAFAFFIYQRDFFFSAAITGMSGIVVWTARHIDSGTAFTVYIGVAKVMVAAALLLYLVRFAEKHGGKLIYQGHSFTLFTKDTVYNTMYLSTLISVVSVIAALILDSSVAFYLLYALVAWLFALLVYYTVRML